MVPVFFEAQPLERSFLMQNWLNKRTQLSPNKTALYYQDQYYTFQQIQQLVKHRAQKLANLSIQPQDHVGLFGHNSLDTYLNILALQQLNATIVFCNIRLAPTELVQQLQDAQVKFCLSDQNDWQLPTNQIQIITPNSLTKLTPQPYPTLNIKNEDVASLMYTSGTTGQPKGVLQTYGNHWASAMNTLLNFQITDSDCWLCVVPLFHISGFSILLRSLIYGIPLYLADKFDATSDNQLLCQQPITIMSVVPTMLQELLQVKTTAYNAHFRLMFLGGAPIDQTTLQICQDQHIPVVQSYGMTETCSNVVALNPPDAKRKLGSCGQALFSNQIRIAKNGEIQLQSPALTPGYWQKSELFQQKLTADGWFKTGDVGYLDAEQFLFVQGRIDDMFVSGGENIFPAEIENLYQQLPQIHNICVTHQSDSHWGSVPVAYVELNQPITSAQLIAYGRQYLAHYKVPVEFRQVQALPKTGSGKLKRQGLTQLNFQLL